MPVCSCFSRFTTSFRAVAAICITLTLAGCGTRGADSGDTSNFGGNSAPATGECSLPEMRNWVNKNMLDYYLFYDQVPSVRLEDYNSPEELIHDLRVAPFDRFSYVSDQAQSTALFEQGKKFGFGMRFERTSATDVPVFLVNPGSPGDLAGVERGDLLLALNGVSLDTITDEQITAAFGTGTDPVTTTFSIQSQNGSNRDITLRKTEFNLQTVLERSVSTLGTQSVGYLNFLSFLETSSTELDEAFDFFNQQGIDELVLDLRYNGGGRVFVARDLASKIVGNLALGRDFARFTNNDKYAAQNDSMQFASQSNALALSRVFILSSESTCSASEMVINGLEPFIDVIVIGESTCGKPYGTLSADKCGKSMHALQFKFENDNGVGDYYNGLQSDCPAADNPNDTLGNTTESMFAAALNYMSTGNCALVAGTRQADKASPRPFNPDPMADEYFGIFR